MTILLNLMEMYDSLILFINIPCLTESEHPNKYSKHDYRNKRNVKLFDVY